MSALEKEVTNYMITTDSASAEAIEASKCLVSSMKYTYIPTNFHVLIVFFVVVNEGSVQDNLLRLIQTLGEYLINDDEFVRAKGNTRLQPYAFQN